MLVMRMIASLAAAALAVQLQASAAETNAVQLQDLAQTYLPGDPWQPNPPAKPETLVAASGDKLSLQAAAHEAPDPRKGAPYWVTPTMNFLSRQSILVSNAQDAEGVVQLLQALTHGAGYAGRQSYSALQVEGGWVVAASSNPGKPGEKSAAAPPYELLVDAANHLTQIRERSYPYLGSPKVYDHTVRTAYAQQAQLNRQAANYEAAILRELAAAYEKEKAAKAAKH